MHIMFDILDTELKPSLPSWLQIVCFSDLESDFINPFELTSRLNRFVVSRCSDLRVGAVFQWLFTIFTGILIHLSHGLLPHKC